MLLAYEVVSLVLGAAQVIVTGPPPGLAPVELVLMLAAFLLVRWIFVLPGLLLVLVGIEFVARRAPHARVLTADRRVRPDGLVAADAVVGRYLGVQAWSSA